MTFRIIFFFFIFPPSSFSFAHLVFIFFPLSLLFTFFLPSSSSSFSFAGLFLPIPPDSNWFRSDEKGKIRTNLLMGIDQALSGNPSARLRRSGAAFSLRSARLLCACPSPLPRACPFSVTTRMPVCYHAHARLLPRACPLCYHAHAQSDRLPQEETLCSPTFSL